ncbi:MAG: energy transducer TonB [Deltaproteobacteria bacterium]|nr:energy transducer TonB [Deltaproteobacteria bacterium]
MKVNSNPQNAYSHVATYAEKRANKRHENRARLATRVVKPVQSDVSKPSAASVPAWLRGGGFALAAILFHGTLTFILMSFGAHTKVQTNEDKVVFRVVEPPQEKRPEKQPEPEAEAKADIPEETAALEPMPEVTPPKEIKPRRIRMAKADPVNRAEKEPEPQPRKRAVVGITMSSTVTGGTGPAYAVGNTRMGATGAVQTKEKIEKLSKGKLSGPGGGNGTATVNRKATFIPTVTSNFTRPKRLSSADLSYPPELKSRGIEGNVVVLIVIDEKGAVQKVRILKSSGYREFDEAALKAAKKELYSPAQRDGEAVEYNLKYTYRFRMKGA